MVLTLVRKLPRTTDERQQHFAKLYELWFTNTLRIALQLHLPDIQYKQLS